MILSVCGFGQTKLTLIGAIEKALDNNYSIKIQRLDENIAGINNNWGTAGRYPSISLSSIASTRADANNLVQVNSSITLNWTLFDGFKVNITKQKLNELEGLSQGYTSILVEGTIQSVVSAYYKAMLQNEILKVYRANEQFSKDRLDYQQMKKDLGNVVSYEVLQARNAYLADQASVLLQEAAVKASLRDLLFLMGEESGDYQLSGQLDATVNTYQFDDLKTAMLQNNTNLKNQYISQVLAEKATDMAKANYFPKLTLSTGYQSSISEINSSSNVFGNLSLSYSIFNGGVRKRAVQIAKIDEEISEIEIQSMQNSLSNQLANLLDYYTARKGMFQLSEERLNVAKINLEISDEKFKAGSINSFNFRDVQLSYQEAAIDRLNAIYNLIDSNTALAKITGRILQDYTQP